MFETDQTKRGRGTRTRRQRQENLRFTRQDLSGILDALTGGRDLHICSDKALNKTEGHGMQEVGESEEMRQDTHTLSLTHTLN